MNFLKLISSTNACMLVIMPLHHATSPCHVIKPHHHAMSSCHIIMTHYHEMSACLYSTDATCHPISGATWHLFLPNLPVNLIEQNAINFSYGVRLRWKECRWNRLDEPFDWVLVLLRLEDFKKISFLDPPGSLGCQLFHHTVLKVRAMVSDKLFQNPEPSNNLVE